MPRSLNSMFATRRCVARGKCATSFGHHAPEAPNAEIVWPGAASTSATAVPLGTGTGATVDADVDGAFVVRSDDEHATAMTLMHASKTRGSGHTAGPYRPVA